MGKRLKRLCCMGLTFILIFGSVSTGLPPVYAAESGISALAETKTLESLKDNAALWVQYDTEDAQTFDGTRVEDYSAQAEAVHKIKYGSIILRFKADPQMGSNCVIFGAKDKTISTTLSTGSDCASFFLENTSSFRFGYKHTIASYKQINYNDGEWHCIVLSSSADKAMRLTIDGAEVWNNTVASNAGLFSAMNVLDQLTVGGHKAADGTVENGFQGQISHVVVTEEEVSDADAIAISRAGCSIKVTCGANIGSMFNTEADNSWVFVGGTDVEGGFLQTRGMRTYIGQFEEYIRAKMAGSPTDNTRQRQTINVGKAGRTLSEILTDWDSLVTAYSPKAVSYFVGKEDYGKGTDHIQTFKTELKQFIEKSLAEKSGKGFAVIQKPYATASAEDNKIIEAYCAAVDEVVASYENTPVKYANIVVVDHYTNTKSDSSWSEKLNADGYLNGKGHFEIGKQLAAATIKTTDGFPNSSVTLDYQEVSQSEAYLDVQPTAKAGDKKLEVTIPEGYGDSWKYQLTIGDVVIEDQVSGNQFTIENLKNGFDYKLKIFSADGKKQLRTMKGTIAADHAAVLNTQVLTDAQKRLAEKVNGEEPMTWLFVGDSITHALLFTYGYDGTAQYVEKYVREVLGREDDVVVNTAVSGATTKSTLANLYERVTKYDADVVTIMLGTNDAAKIENTTTDEYEGRLRSIIAAIKEKNPDVVIVLRTPTYMSGSSEDPLYRREHALLNIERMEKIAAEDPNIILVDQYTEVEAARIRYSWLENSHTKIFGNWLHPGPNGQLIMAHQVLQGMGLWTEDHAMSNLFYDMGISKETSAVVPEVYMSSDTIAVSVDDLEELTGYSLGSLTLTVSQGTKTYTTTIEEDHGFAMIENLPINETYTVQVSGYLKNQAKEVTFQSQQILLTGEETASFTVLLKDPETERTMEQIKIFDGFKETILAELTVKGIVKGDPQYSFSTKGKDNGYFEIQENQLKVKKNLTPGKTYDICAAATIDGVTVEVPLQVKVLTRDLIFQEAEVTVTEGSYEDLSQKSYADTVKSMEEGSVIVKYTSNGEYQIQSLFSVSNGKSNFGNNHFHVYVTTEGALGIEIRNKSSNGFSYTFSQAGAVKVGEENIIAMKADKTKKEYKLFANGELVLTIDAEANGGYYFIQDITGADTVWLGATKRNEAPGYTFAGTISEISVYSTPLSDGDLINATKGIAIPTDPEGSQEPDDQPTLKTEFTDVKDTEKFYYTPVYWAAENGVTKGRADGSFDPMGNVSRGEMVTFLYRLAGSPDVTGQTHGFTDIKSGSFYENAVIWAVKEGIATGTSKTTFEPMAEVTRAQVVTFLYRYAGGTEVTTDKEFSDVPSTKYYYKAVAWAAESKVTSGNQDGTFTPNDPCTRGQAVTFLYRADQLK